MVAHVIAHLELLTFAIRRYQHYLGMPTARGDMHSRVLNSSMWLYPLPPSVSWKTHKEFDEIILLNVFLIVIACLNMNVRFGTIVLNLIFIFKHSKPNKNMFNNMILSNSLCVFQDTLGGNGLSPWRDWHQGRCDISPHLLLKIQYEII